MDVRKFNKRGVALVREPMLEIGIKCYFDSQGFLDRTQSSLFNVQLLMYPVIVDRLFLNFRLSLHRHKHTVVGFKEKRLAFLVAADFVHRRGFENAAVDDRVLNKFTPAQVF